jgi:recombination protein RecA
MARGKEEKEEYKVPKGDSPEDLSAAINKYFKSNVCNVASHAEETQAGIVHLYPTGILSLDKYLGVGGLLGGRIVNIWGWEGTGKTLTALTVAANIQKLRFEPTVLNPKGKGRVAFLDAEGSYSPSMAKSIGVNPDEIILIRSTPERILSGEDYFAMIGILIQNGIEMIIIDSVPALVPSNRLTARIGEGMKATSAQMMAEGLGQVNTFLNSFRRPIVWFINQVRMKPMSMFGPSEDHTGGAALKFFSTYSIEVKKWDKEDIVRMVPNKAGNGWENRTIGVKINATLHKNKTNTIPQENINYLMFFESVTDKEGISYQAGVDVYNDVFQTALLAGVIQRDSSWYNYKDIKGNGEAKFIAALRAADPSILEAIRKEVLTGK